MKLSKLFLLFIVMSIWMANVCVVATLTSAKDAEVLIMLATVAVAMSYEHGCLPEPHRKRYTHSDAISRWLGLDEYDAASFYTYAGKTQNGTPQYKAVVL